MQESQYLNELEILQHAVLNQERTAISRFESGISLKDISNQIKKDIDSSDALAEFGIGMSDPMTAQVLVEVMSRYKLLEQVIINYILKGGHCLDELELDNPNVMNKKGE